MKKTVALLLAFVVLLSLAACGTQNTAETKDTDSTQNTVVGTVRNGG